MQKIHSKLPCLELTIFYLVKLLHLLNCFLEASKLGKSARAVSQPERSACPFVPSVFISSCFSYLGVWLNLQKQLLISWSVYQEIAAADSGGTLPWSSTTTWCSSGSELNGNLSSRAPVYLISCLVNEFGRSKVTMTRAKSALNYASKTAPYFIATAFVTTACLQCASNLLGRGC